MSSFYRGVLCDLATVSVCTHLRGHTTSDSIVPSARAVEYRRWYYAAVSWSDHKLGEALSELKALGVENTTITLFHADHVSVAVRITHTRGVHVLLLC